MKRLILLNIAKKQMRQQRYVDLLMDSGFKAVFGDEKNKNVVIDFLNAILAGEHNVIDVQYLNNELLGEPTTNKGVRFDLHCIDDAGFRFVVEMQRARHSDDFFERSVYYGSRLYSLQLDKGRHDYRIPPVYVIGIMESSLTHERMAGGQNHYVSRYSMRRMDETILQSVAPKTISCIFVQLGFFDKEAEDCLDIIDRWCYSLKNMGELAEQPVDFDGSAFANLYRASEIAQFDQSKRIIYDSERMTERDYQHDMYYSREEGRAEGRAEGIVEGKAEGKAEANSQTARNLKDLGVSVDVIAKATGLSVEEIEKF